MRKQYTSTKEVYFALKIKLCRKTIIALCFLYCNIFTKLILHQHNPTHTVSNCMHYFYSHLLFFNLHSFKLYALVIYLYQFIFNVHSYKLYTPTIIKYLLSKIHTVINCMHPILLLHLYNIKSTQL